MRVTSTKPMFGCNGYIWCMDTKDTTGRGYNPMKYSVNEIDLVKVFWEEFFVATLQVLYGNKLCHLNLCLFNN